MNDFLILHFAPNFGQKQTVSESGGMITAAKSGLKLDNVLDWMLEKENYVLK